MNLFESLNIPYDERIKPYYTEGLEMYNQLGDFIFDKERIIRLNAEYNMFPGHLDVILEAADIVKENKNLSKFCYVIISLLKNRVDLTGIEMPDTGTIDTDFALFFSVFYFAEEMIAEYKSRGLTDKIISDTFQGMDDATTNYAEIFGRPGIRIYLHWLSLYTSLKIIRIDRFNIEIKTFPGGVRLYRKGNDIKALVDGQYMHSLGGVFGSAGMTDEKGKYYAEIKEENGDFIGISPDEMGFCSPTPVRLSGYEEVISKGDMVLSVHIPAREPLTPEITEQSLKNAWNIYKKHYSEYNFKGFVCFSWMLNPHMAEIMGRETNISSFASRFTKFPIESQGNGIYRFVYHLMKPVLPSDLKEDTSLRRNIKNYLEKGNCFFEYGGALFLE